jgi:hypothetical protein
MKYYLVWLLALIGISGQALADYGSGFMEVKCDKERSKFYIWPSILWNEDYDSYLQKHPDGVDIGEIFSSVLLSGIDNQKIIDCKIDNVEFSVEIEPHQLKILRNGVNIYHYKSSHGESIYGANNRYYYLFKFDSMKMADICRDSAGVTSCENLLSLSNVTENKLN